MLAIMARWVQITEYRHAVKVFRMGLLAMDYRSHSFSGFSYKRKTIKVVMRVDFLMN